MERLEGTKQKHSSVAQLKEASLELLDIPEVRHRLGDYATRLTEAVGRSEFTDVNKSNFLDIRDADRDSIPVTARYIGERAVLHADDSGMNSIQHSSLEGKYGTEKANMAVEKTAQYFSENQQHKEISAFEEASELGVSMSNFWLPKTNIFAVGRPAISMNMDSRVNDHLSPVVFLHEMTHVLQNEEQPIREKDGWHRLKISRELEAYYVSAQVILALKDIGRQRELLDHSPKEEMDRARKIEYVRAKYQDEKSPFSVTEPVLKGLVDNELGITPELNKFIHNNK